MFIKTLTTLSLIGTSLSALALDCSATRQYADLSKKSIILSSSIDNNLSQKLAGDIEDIHYSVNYDKDTQDIMAMISEGPDYLNGSISAGQLNSSGQFRLTRVAGAVIFQVICKK